MYCGYATCGRFSRTKFVVLSFSTVTGCGTYAMPSGMLITAIKSVRGLGVMQGTDPVYIACPDTRKGSKVRQSYTHTCCICM